MYSSFKKWQNLSAILFVFALSFGLTNQATAQFWFGGGLVYGEGIENLGLQVNGNLVVNEENKIRIGGDLTYFFSSKSTLNTTLGSTETKVSLFAINVNGHYLLVDTETITFYPIAGINLGFVSTEIEGIGSEFSAFVGDDGTEIGLNIGAGLEYTLEFGGRVFGELTYALGGFEQLVIAAGVRIPILGGNR